MLRPAGFASRPLLVAALLLGHAAKANAICGTTATVPGGYATIQAAVDSAPSSLIGGDHCVIIAAGAYAEQVNIWNIDTNDFRIIIKSVEGTIVDVSPPALSTAAFVIRCRFPRYLPRRFPNYLNGN
ncbi:MAG: hypothetical protein HY747_01455, partial [Elusimicrobia bacterium]|nr:hypothetical protein [Elusimicrobiota bacterium]